MEIPRSDPVGLASKTASVSSTGVTTFSRPTSRCCGGREKEERPARRAPTTHPLPALLGSIRGISRTRKTMRARATALACLVLRCR